MISLHHYSFNFGHMKKPYDFLLYKDNFAFWKIAVEDIDTKGSILGVQR